MKIFFIIGIFAFIFFPSFGKDIYQINSWSIVLQSCNATTLKRYSVDLLVVDIDECINSGTSISSIKYNKKYTVSYLSIGEAEDYRWYWKKSWKRNKPKFLGEENPEWKGNFKVKFWELEWQKIIFKSLDRIIKNGYDGVYLDIIDAYEYYEAKGYNFARKEMINFVIKISKYAKRKKKDFLIIPQNGIELVEDDRYLSAIDGIGKEDTWYYDDEIKDEEVVDYEMKYLERVKLAGKFVLMLDYPTTFFKICDFYNKAIFFGFIPYAARRDLKRLSPYYGKMCLWDINRNFKRPY